MRKENNSDFLSFENLYKGLKKSCRNVRWKTSVTQYEVNGLKNTAKIIIDIQNSKYRISEYQVFEIFEPKRRTITATRIKDRQLQRSLCDNYLYDALTKSFIYDNCACQIGKGTYFAINRLKTHLHKYYHKNRTNDGYFLKCDISHFFDSINHEIAKEVIKKRVKNNDAFRLVCDIIDSFGGDVGIGLGSQVSQLIALTLLDDMDHMIKERLHVKHYVRYIDDFILIHKDKEYLKYCLQEISSHLCSIGLKLNKKTSLQTIHNGVPFLNWRYVLTNTGAVKMFQNKRRFRAKISKLKKMRNLYEAGRLTLDELSQSLDGMVAHVMHCSCDVPIRKLESASGIISSIKLR